MSCFLHPSHSCKDVDVPKGCTVMCKRVVLIHCDVVVVRSHHVCDEKLIELPCSSMSFSSQTCWLLLIHSPLFKTCSITLSEDKKFSSFASINPICGHSNNEASTSSPPHVLVKHLADSFHDFSSTAALIFLACSLQYSVLPWIWRCSAIFASRSHAAQHITLENVLIAGPLYRCAPCWSWKLTAFSPKSSSWWKRLPHWVHHVTYTSVPGLESRRSKNVWVRARMTCPYTSCFTVSASFTMWVSRDIYSVKNYSCSSLAADNWPLKKSNCNSSHKNYSNSQSRDYIVLRTWFPNTTGPLPLYPVNRCISRSCNRSSKQIPYTDLNRLESFNSATTFDKNLR